MDLKLSRQLVAFSSSRRFLLLVCRGKSQSVSLHEPLFLPLQHWRVANPNPSTCVAFRGSIAISINFLLVESGLTFDERLSTCRTNQIFSRSTIYLWNFSSLSTFLICCWLRVSFYSFFVFQLQKYFLFLIGYRTPSLFVSYILQTHYCQTKPVKHLLFSPFLRLITTIYIDNSCHSFHLVRWLSLLTWRCTKLLSLILFSTLIFLELPASSPQNATAQNSNSFRKFLMTSISYIAMDTVWAKLSLWFNTKLQPAARQSQDKNSCSLLRGRGSGLWLTHSSGGRQHQISPSTTLHSLPLYQNETKLLRSLPRF